MRIKFITLNLWEGGKLLDNALDFLKKENADIITLQEVYNGFEPSLEPRFRSLNILKKALGLEYSIFFPTFKLIPSEFPIDQGSAIFFRFPLSDQNGIYFNYPYGERNLDESMKTYNFFDYPKGMISSVVKAGEVEFNVCNVHGVWGTDGLDNEQRLHMAEILVNYARNRNNVIMAGDFNVNQGTETVKKIEEYLDNVFEDKFKTTFNMRQKKSGGFGTAVVDRIFVSRNIKVIDKYQPDVDISDHLPLVSVLDIA